MDTHQHPHKLALDELIPFVRSFIYIFFVLFLFIVNVECLMSQIQRKIDAQFRLYLGRAGKKTELKMIEKCINKKTG